MKKYYEEIRLTEGLVRPESVSSHLASMMSKALNHAREAQQSLLRDGWPGDLLHDGVWLHKHYSAAPPKGEHRKFYWAVREYGTYIGESLRTFVMTGALVRFVVQVRNADGTLTLSISEEAL